MLSVMISLLVNIYIPTYTVLEFRRQPYSVPYVGSLARACVESGPGVFFLVGMIYTFWGWCVECKYHTCLDVHVYVYVYVFRGVR
jgi:hypothetical protein